MKAARAGVQTSAQTLRATRARIRREEEAREQLRAMLTAAFQNAAESSYVLEAAGAIGPSTALYGYAIGALCAQAGLDDAVVKAALARVQERRAAKGAQP